VAEKLSKKMGTKEECIEELEAENADIKSKQCNVEKKICKVEILLKLVTNGTKFLCPQNKN
jgi:hypothetical protein